MNITTLRTLCLAFPGTTEQIQWGADLVFKVGGRMFCVACTEVGPHVVSFKCDPETFADLCEREGIVPAPYLARAGWVALETWDALADRELARLVAEACRLSRERLSKNMQAALGDSPARRPAVRPVGRNVAKVRAKTKPRER